MIGEEATPEQLRALARGARAQEDWETAAAILRRVVKLSPRDPEVWRELGGTLNRIHQPDEALKCLRKAVALSPKDPQLRQEFAVFLHKANEYTQALAQHRQAINQGVSDQTASWVAIGQIHERMHKVDLAKQAANKALERDPRAFDAMELLAKLARRDGDLDEAERLLRAAVEVAPTPERRAILGQSLATVLEKQKRYDEAFEAYTRSNHTLFVTPQGRSAMRHEFPKYRLEFTEERAEAFFQRWAARPEPDDLPSPYILAGFPRSGTTMTEQIIGALEGVTTTDEHAFMNPVEDRLAEMLRALDEPRDTYLDNLDALTPPQVAELRAIYWAAVWREVGPESRERGDRILDKHPMRTLDLGVVNLLFPRAKVIVMIRDPRDCCLSCYVQDLGITPISVRFLTLETLGEIYGEFMGLWVGMRERISMPWMEMRYEDLVSSFEPNARRLVDFLGEPWTERVLEFHKQAAKRTIATPSYEAVTEKVNTRAIGKWSRYEGHLGPLVERVRPYLDLFGYEA